MRSLMTPLLCRRILYSEPIVHKGCIYRTIQRRTSDSRPHAQRQSSRTLFWGISGQNSKDNKHNTPSGLKEIIDLNRERQFGKDSENHSALIGALAVFFQSQSRSRKPLPRQYAEHAWDAVNHLDASLHRTHKQWLSTQAIRSALQVLGRTSSDVGEAHERLAENFLKMLLISDQSNKSQIVNLQTEALLILVQMMRHNEKVLDVQSMLFKKFPNPVNDSRLSQRVWRIILQWYSREGDEPNLLQAVSQIKESGISVTREMYDILIQFYAGRDDVERARSWYQQSIHADNKSTTAVTYNAILRCCSRVGEMEWGNAIARSIADRDVTKEVWDTIFIWAATTGKGVEEVNRLMNLMMETKQGKSSGFEPDTTTINHLIEHSISRNDPYSAERFLNLGTRRNIRPDTETYMLQIIYRMTVNDIDGALAAVKSLRGATTWSDRISSAVNEMVQKLCIFRKQDFHIIMDLVEQLSKRKCPLEAKTVSGLCALHLERNELHEVIDLLKTYSFDYSCEERVPIRDVLVSFCLNPKSPTSCVWDTYMVCRHTFDTEASRKIRTHIMHAFFRRDRPDMACYVFGHMRRHPQSEIRPTTDTYVAFLEGVAACSDGEILEVVHSQLKLDATIDPSTRLLNALMLAYTRCNMAHRSVEFWDEIVASREGPSYDSIRLIFQACEQTQFGDRQARGIWDRLVAMEIGLPKHIFAAYLGAVASHSRLEDSLRLIELGAGRYGHVPDLLMSVISVYSCVLFFPFRRLIN